MPHVSKRVLTLLTSLLLTLGVAAAIPSTPASAAPPGCAQQDQNYGKTQVRTAHAAKAKKKAAKKVKKAKRAYAKKHTASNKKKVKKARVVYRKAAKRHRGWQARNAAAQQAASRCHATTGTPAPQPLPQPFQQLLGTLAGAGLDPAQLQAVAEQVTGALTSGDVSPDTLFAVLDPVVDALTDSGLPAEDITAALQEVLGSLSGGDVPTDPAGLIDLIVDSLQDALATTPLEQLNPVLEQVQTGLNSVLDLLLGGLPLPLP
ncbi:MAG TPA: hypothetical protein VMF51_02845 [Nocardioides sp.]|uniref:hypothetical protein n=1 Tax=Nocardioides sp. TaxID=35761 RepID=UPI002CB41E82|nr:hypothetical protein [Nocardioides sp.]HTW14036.1 hypothetical protein [Nocardioides sp.]